jgi:hypothetical protein
MAEIKDVYSLEFNGSQFQTEINSAIQSIEELNNAMAEGADVADELESAQANLVGVLNTEAKGVEQLNQKRDTLVKTQKQVNAESKAGVAVGKQLDATNKQIAVSTGQAATQQKSFAGSLLQGARNINGLRRAGMMLGNVFRMLGGLNPFGLLLTVLPTVIDYIFGATKAQTAFNEASKSAVESYAKEKVALDDLFTSLNDANVKGSERSAIINQINEQYGDYLPNLLTEASTAEEIAAAYDLVNNALIRKAVTQAKTNALEAATGKLLQDRIAALARQKKAQEDLDASGVGILSRDKDGELVFSTPTSDDQVRAINNFKAAKKNLQNIDKEFKEEVKKINESAKDLEISLGLTEVTPRPPRPPRPQKPLTEINAKTKKELEDLNKRFLREELEQKEEQRQQYLIEEKVFLDDLNKEYEAFLEEKRLADEKALEERRAAEEKYLNEISLERFQKEIEDLETNLQAGLKYREDNRNTQLAQDLLFLEKQRNQELAAATGNAELQAKIDESYNKKRKDIESKANIDILNLRIEFLEKIKEASKDFIDPGTLASLNKQIADLKLQLEEAGKSIGDGLEPPDPKKLIEQIGQVITGISDSVFSVLNAQVQAYISGLDKAIDKSKSALDEIRSNSEDFNARQLEIEKERLEKLEAERARAVEREKNLASVQLAINAAIAISKAAAEGGAAAPITIALTLASLIAGLAQARVAAGNAFYKGVEYLERGNNKSGRDTIPAMLNEGERVITTDTNNKYWDVLSAVHNNRIPADVLNTFSKAYQQGGIKNALGAFGDNVSLSSELGQKSIFVNVAQTYGGLENRLERIENVLTELPKYMPRTTVSANANGIFKIVEQRQARKNFSRNWSK